MKKLLSKVFFASDCARDALFAMTLLTVGNYLWLSFFLMVLLILGEFHLWTVWSFLAGAVLLTVFGLVTAVAALVRFIGVLRRERRFKVLWYLLPAGACLAAGVIGFLRFLPPVLLTVMYTDRLGDDRDFCRPWISGGLPGVEPKYWAACFLISLLLILAAGVLQTAMFAAAEGKKLRSAFGRATLTVWGLLVLWYFVTLGLALHESREVAAVRAAVEARFGRPLTAAGIEALYREGGPIDAKFWERQKECCDALPKVKLGKTAAGEEEEREKPFVDFDVLPDRPAPETLAWYGGYCRDNRAALARLEGGFDRVPPLPAREFVPGGLIAMLLSDFQLTRDFVRLESSRVICALAAGDVETAWACYRRMGNAGEVLRHQPFLIGGLVWLAVGGYRLNAVEKLLESRLLSDARLEELDADLAALELAVPSCHRQSMYGEATFGLDAVTALEEGLIDYNGWMSGAYEKSLALGGLAPYRWIFPQYWYHAALDKEAMLRVYLAEDFTKFVPPSNRLLIMSNMVLPAFDRGGRRFYALTARIRGMRALIRAEKYRRKHGEFPKTLADLPEDPFTGRPLIYEIGPAEISEYIWNKPVASWGKTVKRRADVVQVHSDPAVTTKHGLCRPQDGSDLTRSLIRLPR